MHSTYQNLKELAKLHTGSTEFYDLAFEYQVMEGEAPIIFSVAFCGVFALINQEMEKYYTLTYSDKMSVALEELHNALMNFDPDRNVKFLTVFAKYLKNRFKTEITSSLYQKRIANVDAVQDDEYQDMRSECSDEYQAVELRHMLDSYNLTPNERQYCEMVMVDTVHIRDVDVATKLGITSAGVNWIRNSLQRKLSGLLIPQM